MNPLWALAILWVCSTSLFGFALMGLDKVRAIHGERRIRERTFHKIAAFGGAFGILAAMSIFHHKAHKDSLDDVALIAAVAWVVVLFELQSVIGPLAL
jgi:uncharacterized membrane protein YsdA (DUF1294 family)